MPRGYDPAAAESLVAENLGLADLSSESLGDTEAEPELGDAEDEGDMPDEADDDAELQDDPDALDDDLVTHKRKVQEPLDSRLRDVRLQPGEREPVVQPRAGERAVKFDAKGNIIDAKTKQVIATAGPAARFYVDAYKARGEVVKQKAETNHWRSQLDKAIKLGEQIDAGRKKAVDDLKASQELGRSLGLEPHEIVDATRLAAEIKRNPEQGLKSLLTRAAANGIDLTKLGLQGTGFDPHAFMNLIGQEIDKRMTPLVERTKTESQQAQEQEKRRALLEETERNAQRYFAQNPEMVPHMPLFKAVLDNPETAGMSLGEIGARIQLALLRQRMQRGQNPRRRSLPNGRGNGMGPETPDQRDEIAHPSESYDNIIKGALDQAGIR